MLLSLSSMKLRSAEYMASTVDDPFCGMSPIRTRQLWSNSVTSLPPFRWLRRSARIASSLPVIFRNTTRRCSVPSSSLMPMGNVNSRSVRPVAGAIVSMDDASVLALEPLVLEDDGLLHQAGGA